MDNVTCPFCTKPVTPGDEGTYAEVSGWSVFRSAGGANQVSLRRETGRYAHGPCVRLAINGVDPANQATLIP